MHTCNLGASNSIDKYIDEPFEGILIHRVDVRQIRDAEEQDLRVDGDRYVLTSRRINVLFSLFSYYDFRLFAKIYANSKFC